MMNIKSIRVSGRFLFALQNCIRNRSTTTILEPETPKISTVDDDEVAKHGQLASGWWNENGSMKALHSMNKLRVQFIRNGLIFTQMSNSAFEDTSKPLSGVSILEVGCGGGILCEPLARIGAQVTGIDAGADVIQVAKNHAAQDNNISGRLTYLVESIEDHCGHCHEKYDAVVASEVLEHVTEKDIFLESCCKALKPGGSMFVTTVNRTMPAWVAGVIAAEYLLHLVPQNTHEWEKFATPQEVQYMLEKHDCHTKLIHGMFYNFLCDEWYWTPNTAINYALHAVKKK